MSEPVWIDTVKVVNPVRLMIKVLQANLDAKVESLTNLKRVLETGKIESETLDGMFERLDRAK